MATELKDYIKCYDDVLDDSFCQDIKKFEEDPEQEYLDREQRPSFSELNISQRYLANDSKWMNVSDQSSQ